MQNSLGKSENRNYVFHMAIKFYEYKNCDTCRKAGKYLDSRGLSYERMRAFGLEYRALADLLEKKVGRKEFEERLTRDIRRYAKRQITYWRRNSDIRWISASSRRRIPILIRRWLKQAVRLGHEPSPSKQCKEFLSDFDTLLDIQHGRANRSCCDSS